MMDWLSLDAEMGYLILTISISVVIAATDIALERQFKQNSFFAVFHKWAVPIYLLYALTTWLIVALARENGLIEQMTLTSAVTIGLAGPGILRSQFRIIDTQSENKVNRIFIGVREIFISRILKSIAIGRLKRLERAAQLDEQKLMSTLESILSGAKLEQAKKLIDKRKSSNPSLVNILIVSIIDNNDPHALGKLSDDSKKESE